MNTFPGINKRAKLDHFSDDEKRIIEMLSTDWYITNGGSKITLNENSVYRFFLMKPTRDYQEMFNIEREIVTIFSPYSDFEPRTLDAFEYVYKNYQDLRLENVCCVLISKDKNIKDRISDLIKGDPESRVIIPFSYEDFIFSTNTYFVKNRFRNFFFDRDLFAFESPITKDFFFFGRTNLIQKLISRYKSNENSGLFGLRKTGKTSVINGIARALHRENKPTVILDCQDTSFNQRRWNKALFYIIKEIKSQNRIKCIINDENKYDEQNAGSLFEKDLKRICKKIGNKSILIIFDEIENISPKTAPNEFWRNELDFILFWQTIRSKFQKFIREGDSIFSFLIVGTNPKAVETPRINESENPIFNKVAFEFIKGFSVEQTKEMVNKLGGYMGLQFDDSIYSKLKDDFGGHPYLMRHFCSIINEFANKNRPTTIDKIHYEKAKKEFSQRYSHYLEMILEVLIKFYPEEYDMLTYLAIEDVESFKNLANFSSDLIAHLKGYELIAENDDNYYFKIESVKEYLKDKNKYKIKHNSSKERWREISERRNRLEPRLRQIVRMQLQSHYGKADATKKILDIYGEPRKSKLTGLSYSELFDPNKTDIYLNDIIKAISKFYDDIFKNTFGSNKSETIVSLETINKYRTDAHAKDIKPDEMEFFRVHISKIEKNVEEFL